MKVKVAMAGNTGERLMCVRESFFIQAIHGSSTFLLLFPFRDAQTLHSISKLSTVHLIAFSKFMSSPSSTNVALFTSTST